MTAFSAWYTPPGFTLAGDEVASGPLETWDKGEGGDGQTASFQYAALSKPRLLELMDHLRRERELGLSTFPVRRIVDVVDGLAGRFLDAEDELRKAALETLGLFAGFSAPMAEAVMDGMARGWMREGLWDLVRSEFPDPGVLDGFRPGPAGDESRASGFSLAFHLGAGTVPGVATTSMIRSLLVKSAVLLKPGLGDLSLPILFARGLEEADREMARCVAVLYWPVDESGRTETALREVDLAVVYGSDETVSWARGKIPPQTPFRAYRHRMGFGLIGRDALVGDAARTSARSAAMAVAMFDQRGCVSPHAFFVENGTEVGPEEWAALLADSLGAVEATLPSGEISPEDGIAIQQLRGSAELAEGMGKGRVYHGGVGVGWTVLYDPRGEVEPSCLNRTVRVIPVEEMGQALELIGVWKPYLQTVGVAGLGDRLAEIANNLAGLGVSRITGLAGMPWPHPWWHHDGTGPLRDLVRWTDVEGGGVASSGSGGE